MAMANTFPTTTTNSNGMIWSQSPWDIPPAREYAILIYSSQNSVVIRDLPRAIIRGKVIVMGSAGPIVVLESQLGKPNSPSASASERPPQELIEVWEAIERVEESQEELLVAKQTLDGIRDAALDDGCDEPTVLAIGHAKELLERMYEMSPRHYDIYPMGGGEIVIDGGGKSHRIGVFCYPDGRIMYIGWVDGERRKIRRIGVDDMPLDFLKSALAQLDDS